MMKRIQARMDKEGVSEVLGSILTLIVTVTLFSSIFIGVQSLQAPDKGNYIEFETTFEEGKDNYYINITNVGDGTLTSQSSVNLVNDDGLTISYDFSDHSNKNGWNLGHALNLELEKNETNNEIFDSNIELLIIDKKNSRVVWRDDIKTGDTLAPIIQDYGVNYPQDWESYTLADEKVTLWADVIDRDTNDNLDVTVNISKLEGHDGLEELKPVGKYKQKESNTFKTRITLDDRQPNGTYLLKLNATDGVNENKETHYFVLHVGEFAVAEDANLKVSSNKFISSPETPQNGQNYSITAPVYNDGGKKATADIEFW
ncbi:MAG: type IV pilin N-terminal domain-containing protein, partial [Thermoplasmatota archaeon]